MVVAESVAPLHLSSHVTARASQLLLGPPNKWNKSLLKSVVTQSRSFVMSPIRKTSQRMFTDMRERFGDADILVNNAGIAESATLVNTTDELWHRHLSINLSGTFYCTRAALPAMLKKGWGRVINVASIAGKTGAPYVAAYSASKHGVMGLTRSLALEVATTGITVNAICPGYVDTEMVSRGVEQITTKTGRTAEEALDSLKKMSPQNRLVTPEEVAAMALLLASDEGRGINGQGINVDGGSVPLTQNRFAASS